MELFFIRIDLPLLRITGPAGNYRMVDGVSVASVANWLPAIYSIWPLFLYSINQYFHNINKYQIWNCH